ncbi:MAG: metal ABC transporter solute-binding protein, Zn/Mn family [Mycobacterium sp.]
MKATVGLATVAIVVAACGQDRATSHQDDNGVSVVASTDVWGSVAGAVAGEHASVKSIETGVTADPHSYEASPADAAAIADASLVVYNGGEYDHWVDDVLASHPEVNAIEAYPLRADSESANEHVFYDVRTAKAVAAVIADRLGDIEPALAGDYRSNATEFGKLADAILESGRAIGRAHPSASVVATEPVAYYLLRNAGIADRTPPGFASAVAEGDDPPPADVAAMLDLIDSHQVSALLFNPQTETAATKQIADAARRVALPVVTVTETLPQGMDYLTWQRQTVEQLAGQLNKAPQANR